MKYNLTILFEYQYVLSTPHIYIYIYIYECVCVCVCVCVCLYTHSRGILLWRVCWLQHMYITLSTIYFLKNQAIGLVGRVFENGPGDRGSIPGWVILKNQKMILDDTLLNIQYYKVQIKRKWSKLRKEVVSSPTPLCSSYWKRSQKPNIPYKDLGYAPIMWE